MSKKPEIFLGLSFGILGLLTIIFLKYPKLGLLFSGFNDYWLFGDIQATSPLSIYLFVWFITFVGNAGIFTSIPYAAVIVMVATRKEINPYILAGGCILSAGIGEMTGYLLGIAGRKILEKRGNGSLKKIDTFRYLAENKKYILYLLIVLVTATPLPDDIVFIPLGLIRFGFLETLVFSIIGKGILVGLLIFGGKLISGIFTIAKEISPYAWVDDIIVYALIVLGIYIFMKIDFNKLAEWFEKKMNLRVAVE
ncbi:MAG: hypothetical protein ACTSVA_02665 [Candidatus Njordarchaeales archaeon]